MDTGLFSGFGILCVLMAVAVGLAIRNIENNKEKK